MFLELRKVDGREKKEEGSIEFLCVSIDNNSELYITKKNGDTLQFRFPDWERNGNSVLNRLKRMPRTILRNGRIPWRDNDLNWLLILQQFHFRNLLYRFSVLITKETDLNRHNGLRCEKDSLHDPRRIALAIFLLLQLKKRLMDDRHGQ